MTNQPQPLDPSMFGLGAAPTPAQPQGPVVIPGLPAEPPAQAQPPQTQTVAPPPAQYAPPPVAQQVFTPQPAAPIAQVPPAPAAAPPPATSNYHGNVSFGSLDDDNIKTGDYDAYKGTLNRTDRLSFLNPRQICFGRAHFVEAGQKKGFYLCDSKFVVQGGQEVPVYTAPCCQKLGPPKKRFSVLVAHLATDNKGTLTNPFSLQLKVWRFGEPLFDSIRAINRAMSLEQYDLLAKCTDDKFHKFDLIPAPQAIVRVPQVRAAYGAEIDAYVAAMTPRLDRTVGYANTAAEWAELLGAPGVGLAGPSAAQPDAAIANIGELLKMGG